MAGVIGVVWAVNSPHQANQALTRPSSPQKSRQGFHAALALAPRLHRDPGHPLYPICNPSAPHQC